MFSCGTAKFSHMDHDEPSPPTPSAPKGSSSKKHQKQNKNPYATRGLDKFSMVLAELQSKRENIIQRAGSQGVAMVRFMYDNSQDWVPIIVRPPKDQSAAKCDQTSSTELIKKPPAPQPAQEEEEKKDGVERKEMKKKRRSLMWSWRGSYYWPLVMVLILLCVVVFGRVFAICCTCVWWYVVPNMNLNVNMKEKKLSTKKMEARRRLSDKRLGKDLVVQVKGKKMAGGNLQDLASPRAHGNGKKG